MGGFLSILKNQVGTKLTFSAFTMLLLMKLKKFGGAENEKRGTKEMYCNIRTEILGNCRGIRNT